jgi:hypothetical protein
MSFTGEVQYISVMGKSGFHPGEGYFCI